MNKEALWKIYTDKNPHFLERGANLTPEALRKFFDQTWDVAHKRGVDTVLVMAEKNIKSKPTDTPAIFDQIFGKGYNGAKQ